MLANILCVAKNLELNGAPWRWCRRTPKSFGAI